MKSTYDKYTSQIPRINIFLENFHFFHSPSSDKEIDPKFHPRNELYQHFANWLLNNRAKSAIYLITGYRGAGKTSFVSYTIHKLNQRKQKFNPISISLGHDNIQEVEILRILAKQIYDLLPKIWFRIFLLLKILCTISAILIGGTILTGKVLIMNIFEINQGIILPILIMGFVLCSYGQKFCNIYRLQKLCDRLNATVTEDKVSTTTWKMNECIVSKLQDKYQRVLPPATLQEIEYELIEVIKRYNRYSRNPRLIVIFDELDKIATAQEEDKNDISTDYEKLSSRPGQPISSRKRKEQVLALIANLKYFLSTAQATFVFIAGREMYESFQNDMSDRDFSISSIFNGILNIDSFLYSNIEENNVTLQTERFVCSQLLPENFHSQLSGAVMAYVFDKKPSLKNYLLYRIYCRNDWYEGESQDERHQRIWDEVLFLYHFIHYLTFISNGSPKKITLFFEKYIRNHTYLEEEKQVRFPQDAVAEKVESAQRFYLSFGYYSQTKINFIHYLLQPILTGILNDSNQFGDKLLVSASFLVAYIFKLHNNGFSWRNLEQMPEIQEINRTPEIREYLGMVINFMNHGYLVTNPCSLYHYKFPMKIVEEISFHSKISSEVSSLFNFASDEFLPIKNKYKRLLRKYTETEGGNHHSVYAKASIHHSLGDILMLEENYSGAIREYEYCVELIQPIFAVTDGAKKIEAGTQQLNYLMFLNRSILKLGLAHEKRRTDNSAFMAYQEMIKTLKRTAPHFELKKDDFHNYTALYQNNRMIHLSLLAQLYTLEKLDTTGITSYHIKDVCNNFKSIFSKKLRTLNPLLSADFYRKLGDILYYKNQSAENNWKNYTAFLFYRKSLCLLLDIPYTDSDNQFCKKVWKNLNILSQEKNGQEERDNVLYYEALICESIAHTYLAHSNDEFSRCHLSPQRFLIWLYCWMRQPPQDKEPSQVTKFQLTQIFSCIDTHCQLERAIIFYGMASHLYNRSCERNLSGRCYKSMVYSLTIYNRMTGYTDWKLKLNLIKETSRHALITNYRQKEFISYAEECVMREYKQLNLFNMIPINQLSMIPDTESLLFFYYKQKLEGWLYFMQAGTGKWIGQKTPAYFGGKDLARFFHSRFMTGRHTFATLNGTIYMLKLKAIFHQAILEILLGHVKEENGVDKLLNTNFCHLQTLLEEHHAEKDLKLQMLSLFYPDQSHQCGDDMKHLLHHLINEGIFCLSRILELLDAQRDTTVFLDSFKADIYCRLMGFVHLYKLLYCYYSFNNNWHDNNNEIRRILKEELLLDLEIEDLTNIPVKNALEDREELVSQLKKKIHSEHSKYLSLPFLCERSIYFYARARQLHTQGKSYQEMIRNLFFLEEDLNNDTLQFYLAVDRRTFVNYSEFRKETDLKKRYYKYRNYQIKSYV